MAFRLNAIFRNCKRPSPLPPGSWTTNLYLFSKTTSCPSSKIICPEAIQPIRMSFSIFSCSSNQSLCPNNYFVPSPMELLNRSVSLFNNYCGCSFSQIIWFRTNGSLWSLSSLKLSTNESLCLTWSRSARWLGFLKSMTSMFSLAWSKSRLSDGCSLWKK
jgi:hypothetical protein